MQNVYEDPAYEDIKNKMHRQLIDLRIKYKDSDSLNQYHLDRYLGAKGLEK